MRMSLWWIFPIVIKESLRPLKEKARSDHVKSCRRHAGWEQEAGKVVIVTAEDPSHPKTTDSQKHWRLRERFEIAKYPWFRDDETSDKSRDYVI